MELQSIPIAVIAILIRRIIDALNRPAPVQRALIPSGRLSYAILPLALLYIYGCISRGKVSTVLKNCGCRLRGLRKLRERHLKPRRPTDPWHPSRRSPSNYRFRDIRLNNSQPLLTLPASTPNISLPTSELPQPKSEQPQTSTTTLQAYTSDPSNSNMLFSNFLFQKPNNLPRLDLTTPKKENMMIVRRTTDGLIPTSYSEFPEPILRISEPKLSSKELRAYHRNMRFGLTASSADSLATSGISGPAFMNRAFLRRMTAHQGTFKSLHKIKKGRAPRKPPQVKMSTELEKKTTRSGHIYGYRH